MPNNEDRIIMRTEVLRITHGSFSSRGTAAGASVFIFLSAGAAT